MHYGIDISSNNSHPLNWAAIKTYLMSLGNQQPFVIVKINQGANYENPFALGDIKDARAHGFAVAGYLMDEGNQDVGVQQAAYKQIAAGLPETFDIELPEGLTPAQYAAHARLLVKQNPKALSYLNQSEVASGFPTGGGLWLAQYNKTPGQVAYHSVIHQYDDAGVIPGQAGVFDLNVWLDTEAAFDAFFGITPPAPKPKPQPIPLPKPGQPHPSVKQGDTGPLIEELQKSLNAWGTKLKVDGKFGPLTMAAVKHFQAAHHLPQTGVVDGSTWAILPPSKTKA